jgi:hypothetical protein
MYVSELFSTNMRDSRNIPADQRPQYTYVEA